MEVAQMLGKIFDRFVEQSPVSVIITDTDGNIEYVNARFVNVTGYTSEEVQGKNPRILQSGYTSAKEYKKLWGTIASGGTWKGEFRNKKKNGELFWESAIISPVLSQDGAIMNFLGVKEDITERKKLEQQYLRAQKMESLGRLAGGVAHDFNNYLSVVSGYSELLLEELAEDKEKKQKVETILEACEKSKFLTDQLLAFGRREIVKPILIDLNKLVTDMEKILRRLVGEDIQLSIRLSKDLKKIKLDQSQIEQVIMNMVANARDAISHGGKISQG